MNAFQIDDHGTIVVLRPITEAAEEWLRENVAADEWQWIDGGLAIEPRYVESILDGWNDR